MLTNFVVSNSGGPAGCVVAGRLAYADPNLKVMLIEGGANNRDDPWVYRCEGFHLRRTPSLIDILSQPRYLRPQYAEEWNVSSLALI